MTIQLKETLKLPEFEKVQLLAGAEGLDRRVTWVNVLEILDDLAQLNEGDLFVTTAAGLTGKSERWQAIVETLLEKKVAALAIQPGYYLEAIPNSLIELCNKYHLPLLEIPSEESFGRLTRAVAQQVIRWQDKEVQQAQQIQSGMMHLLLERQGLEGIIKRLGELLDRPVQIFDFLGHPQSSYNHKETDPVIAHNNLGEYKKIRKLLWSTKDKAVVRYKDYLLYPLLTGTHYYGYIQISTDQELTSSELMILTSAGTMSLLEMIKWQEVWEAEERIRGDFLDDLLEGNWDSTEEIYLRGKRLGYDLKKRFVVVAVQKPLESKKQLVEKDVQLWLRTLLEKEGVSALIRDIKGRLMIFIVLDKIDEERLVSIVEVLQKSLQENIQERLLLGVSRIKESIDELTISLKEARFSLEVGQYIEPDKCIHLYSNLGVYILLGEIAQTRESLSYYEGTMGSLVTYDRLNKTELIRSLQVFFESNLEIRETARQLFIHRHSLSYRLKRIEEISGLSPSKYPDRIRLELGLLLLPLIENNKQVNN